MLDDVRRVTNDPWDDDLSFRKPHIFPDPPFVFVAGVGRLERVPASLDLQHQVDDVPELDVSRVGAVPTSPAEVKPDLLLGQVAQCVIQRLHPNPGEVAVVLDRGFRIDLVPVLGNGRIVDLHDQAGIDDDLVLLTHRIGTGVDELLFGGVVRVANARGAARRDSGNKPLAVSGSIERRLEVGDIGLHRLLTGVGQGSHADRQIEPALVELDARGGILVGVGELGPVAAIRETREDDVARGGPSRDLRFQSAGPKLEPAQALERVRPPGAVIDLAGHRLAELAIIGNGDSGVLLLLHDVDDGTGEQLVEALQRAACFHPPPVGIDKLRRARQAADM